MTRVSREKKKLLSEITRRNERLFEVLNRKAQARLYERPTTRPSQQPKDTVSSLMASQAHAAVVSNALQEHWLGKCPCPAATPCLISARGSDFQILFGKTAGSKQIDVQVKQVRADGVTPLAEPRPATGLDDVTRMGEEADLRTTYKKSTAKVPKALVTVVFDVLNPTGQKDWTQPPLLRKLGKLVKR